MISTADLHRWASREGLRFDQAEKDYVILLALSELAATLPAPSPWVFKGGTCLRHCYYPGYRFSEDMDFTLDASADPGAVTGILGRVADSARERYGVNIDLQGVRVDRVNGQMEASLGYLRGGRSRRDPPTVKVHISLSEPLLTRPEVRRVEPPHPAVPGFSLVAYSKIEIVAEKARALLQQQSRWPRPRDLYDLWHITCLKGEAFDRAELRKLFDEKCRVRGVAPDPAGLYSANLCEWNQKAWDSQLVPTLRNAPPYEQVWSEWTERCRTLL